MASLRVAEPPHDPLRLVWLFQGLNLLLFFFFFFFFFFFLFLFLFLFIFLFSFAFRGGRTTPMGHVDTWFGHP
jgi:hypothetical protein